MVWVIVVLFVLVMRGDVMLTVLPVPVVILADICQRICDKVSV